MIACRRARGWTRAIALALAVAIVAAPLAATAPALADGAASTSGGEGGSGSGSGGGTGGSGSGSGGSVVSNVNKVIGLLFMVLKLAEFLQAVDLPAQGGPPPPTWGSHPDPLPALAPPGSADDAIARPAPAPAR